MVTSDNYLGYNTYILGSTKNVLECLGIILYNKSDFDNIEKISLYNIKQVFDKVVSSKKYLKINRDNYIDTFSYSHLNDIILGFNVIIYLSNSDNLPIGYTEFLSIQGLDKDINLSLNLTTNTIEKGEISLLNSLSTLKNTTSVSKSFITEDLYNYSSSRTILSDLKKAIDIYPRYTTHLSSVKKNNINDNIFLDYGIINKDSFFKLTLSKNININPFEIDFKNYQFGYYENDIVIYSWVDNKYSIYSLIKKNKFKNPISYTDTLEGYCEIPKYPSSTNTQRVNYFSGKYIVIGVEIDGQEKEVIYNIELKDWVTTSLPNFVIDQLDVHSEILEYPKILNYSNVFDYFPDIINTYLDLKSFSNSNNINVIRKIGGWYVIRQKRLNNKNILIYTNISKTLYTLEDEHDTPTIVNDKILFTTSIKDDKKYYSFYTEDNKTYFTEAVRSTLFKGEMRFNDQIGAYIFEVSDNSEENKKNFLQYTSGAIKIVNVGDNFLKSYLTAFRRNIINDDILTVPEIIGSINGLIFYKSQNNLNYI